MYFPDYMTREDIEQFHADMEAIELAEANEAAAEAAEEMRDAWIAKEWANMKLGEFCEAAQITIH